MPSSARCTERRYGRPVEEVHLTGGRVTAGVLRIGDTVRRPARPNSVFVRELLAHLDKAGFEAAPRYLGCDAEGRDIFSFLPGDVPRDLDPAIDDGVLAAAARLIRRYHDATADSEIARSSEVVRHGDLSPCNFVFQEGQPVGIIDFDAAAPGGRLHDLGYAIFLWLNLGTDGPRLDEQARRIDLFCRAYGTAASREVVEAITEAVADNVERLRLDRRLNDATWWQVQLDWLRDREEGLAELLIHATGIPQ
jgi:Phosphotransferase enzyme family